MRDPMRILLPTLLIASPHPRNACRPSSGYFRQDPDIPKLFRSNQADYHRTGYDKGHLVPCADITSTLESMKETFLITNACPQHLNFNRGIW